jgi:uncharacterized protein (DUF1800 family)
MGWPQRLVPAALALGTGLILWGCQSAPSAPVKPELRTLPVSTAPLDTNGEDLALLERVTWGGNTRAAQALAKMGADAFLEAQLNPGPDDGLPPAVRAQIDELPVTHESPVKIGLTLTDERKAQKNAGSDDEKAAARKAYQDTLREFGQAAATRSLLRDLYSQNQLKEQLTWFWMNHFNVHANKADIRALVGDYEEHAIRPHVLGRFRDLLEATAFHPAMLRYLDNADNAVGHINENYAREIMELHTLGVHGGYTQTDVQELARILTGVGINETGNLPKVRPTLRGQYVRNGVFEFNPNRHDYGDKKFLGRTIHGSGLDEVEQAIDILSQSPATANFISRKLAEYFEADEPSPALVQTMAGTFEQTGGDIRAVLETLFHSSEFHASLRKKFKDPIHFVVSAVRATYGDEVVTNVEPMLNWMNRMGEPLYGHETPDGYPLIETAWAGSGDMSTRFEIARAIGSGHAGLFKLPDNPAPEPPFAPRIGDTPYYQVVAQSLSSTTTTALAAATSPADLNTMFLSTPEFMHR